MTPKKPVTAPQTPIKRERPIGGGRMAEELPWQERKDRKETNRRAHTTDKKNPRKMQQAYSKDEHPKDAKGSNICWAEKKDGTHCHNAAGFHTDHEGYGKCSFHGGNTPTLRTSAARFIGGEVIDRMTTAYGYGRPIELSPIDALLQEVRRTGGHVAWIAEKINMWEMDTNAYISGEKQQWIELYHKERAHLVKVAKTAIDAGVSERMVKIAENQGLMIIKAFNTVFDALHLTTDQRRMIPQVVPGVLRELTDPGSGDREPEPVDAELVNEE